MDKVIKFENDFNIKFNNRVLFKRALTHSSFQHSQWGVNERLEFLGDAVVQIIITKYLYDNFVQYASSQTKGVNYETAN